MVRKDIVDVDRSTARAATLPVHYASPVNRAVVQNVKLDFERRHLSRARDQAQTHPSTR